MQNITRLVNSTRMKGGEGKKNCVGITKLLDAMFFRRLPQKRGAKSNRFGGPVGRKRGNLIDRQVTRVIKNDRVHKKSEVLHPYTRAVFSAIDALKLRAIDTQVYCCSQNFGIHTWADIVCRNENGEVVLLEQKCGYHAKTFFEYTHMCRGVCKQFPNSPHIHAQLQLALTAYMFRKTYKDLPVKAYVVRVDDNGATVVKLSERIIDIVPIILHEIQQRQKDSA